MPDVFDRFFVESTNMNWYWCSLCETSFARVVFECVEYVW